MRAAPGERMMTASPLQEPAMPRAASKPNSRRRQTAVAWLLATGASLCAAEGLTIGAGDTAWPLGLQWQARLTWQLAPSALGPYALTPMGSEPTLAEPRVATGASLLGDVLLAEPAFGRLRASGGLLLGSWAGAPLRSQAAGARLGVSLAVAEAAPGDAAWAVPYLGLGFSSQWLGPAWSLSADIGWVAERPGAFGQFGRALFGNAGASSAWRELRVAPVVQLGVRYLF
jgi:hypothetical protein